MNPLSPFVPVAKEEPNFELLRRAGWSPSCITGAYCVAWRGRDEVVFEWRDGEWHRVGGRGFSAAA
jgi:hypothetical protein